MPSSCPREIHGRFSFSNVPEDLIVRMMRAVKSTASSRHSIAKAVTETGVGHLLYTAELPYTVGFGWYSQVLYISEL